MVSRSLAITSSFLRRAGIQAVLVLGFALCAEATQLVHPYPPTGPIEVAGAPSANKVLRTVQRYAMPAFTDLLAEHVAHVLRDASDEPVAVVRKSRRSGREAIDAVGRAAPDGRTLLLAIDAPSLRGVARVAVMPYVIVVRKDAPYGDVAELIAGLRASADRLLAASAGEQTVSHAALGMLSSKYGLRVEPVSYKGGYAALQALVTKEVNAALVPLPSVTPYAPGGKIKVLAAAKPASIDVADAFHLFAPPGTPSIAVARLNVAIAEKLVTPDAQAVFSKLGVRLEHRGAGGQQR